MIKRHQDLDQVVQAILQPSIDKLHAELGPLLAANSGKSLEEKSALIAEHAQTLKPPPPKVILQILKGLGY